MSPEIVGWIIRYSICAGQFSPVMATATPTSAVPPGTPRVNVGETHLQEENVCSVLLQWEAMHLVPFIRIRRHQCDFPVAILWLKY